MNKKCFYAKIVYTKYYPYYIAVNPLGGFLLKKIISAILVSVFIFLLGSCSGKNGDSESTSVSESETKTINYISDWGSAVVPDDFPAPPSKAHAFSVSNGKADEAGKGYRSDWTRLTFTCPEQEIYGFSNQLSQNGYIGGMRKMKNPTYYSEGFNGNWQNGKTFVRIVSSEDIGGGETKFVIDFFDCTDNFPDALTEYFPKFNGYTKSGGYYYGYTSSDNIETETFSGSFHPVHWNWDFGFENAFVGVSQSEFEDYVSTLADSGFSGQYINSVLDGCSVISVDMVKYVSNNESYGAFMLYNQILKTFDIVYTNNIADFLDVEEQSE